MRVTFGKRLFILVAVFALVGAPWVQALAQGSQHHCDISTVAAATDVAADQAARCDMPAHKTDGGKTMPAACTQDCLTQVNLVVPVIGLFFVSLPHVFEAAARPAMTGHPPDPELSPPIALA